MDGKDETNAENTIYVWGWNAVQSVSFIYCQAFDTRGCCKLRWL